MTHAIGIDIGGTKISLALGNRLGHVLQSLEMPTRSGAQTRSCLKELFEGVEKLLDTARKKKIKVTGIGICLPGAVDSEKGVAPRSPNLPGWKGIPLKNMFEKKFKIKTRLANDANAAAVAEAVFGQGRGIRNFIYVTVSTGVGAGIYADGKLLEGASFVAGEVGHMTIVPEGKKCHCGQRGCLEAYASGTAIRAGVREALSKKKPSVLWKMMNAGVVLDARLVGRAASLGDPLARKSYQEAAYYLGVGLANLLNVLNPEKIILGGGVFKSAPGFFWKAILSSTRQHAWPEAFRAVKIVRSNLKEGVGNLGALALAF